MTNKKTITITFTKDEYDQLDFWMNDYLSFDDFDNTTFGKKEQKIFDLVCTKIHNAVV